MTIRIDTAFDGAQSVFKVAGRLCSQDTHELRRVTEAAHGRKALDLSELRSADREGVEILRELIALGAEVRGASPYIALLLTTKTT